MINSDNLINYIAKKISTLRIAKNLSARQLSFDLGQSADYINQIETCRAFPSITSLFNICEYFGITIGEFFNEEIAYPLEYKEIIKELNKLDKIELENFTNILKMVTSKKK